MAIRIKEIAFVFHPITDAARARGFYEGTLGLKPGLQIEFSPGMWWIEYDIAGVALALCNAPLEENAVFKPSSSLTLEVDDLDQALAGLRAAGVPIAHEPVEYPPCRMFSATDPDKNEIRFHQRKANAAT